MPTNAFHSGDVPVALTFVSILYVALVLLVLWLARAVEFKLLALGLLTGVLSVWIGALFGGESVSIQAQGATHGSSGLSFVGGAAAPLGRIAVLLILGGLVAIFRNRLSQPKPLANEEGIRAERV